MIVIPEIHYIVEKLFIYLLLWLCQEAVDKHATFSLFGPLSATI